MNENFTLKVLDSADSMMVTFDVLSEVYTKITPESYREMLQDMIPNNYKQLAVFDGEKCIGVNGFWINTKIWCGKYLELDNIAVLESHRSQGIGKLMFDFLEKMAKETKCDAMMLDAYTQNFKAHKLYYNLGFEPRGFHFIKHLS